MCKWPQLRSVSDVAAIVDTVGSCREGGVIVSFNCCLRYVPLFDQEMKETCLVVSFGVLSFAMV